MVRKTKEEAGRTRAQIIEAARGVFHRDGVERSTLERVARAAGLTRGAVYWHFKNKAELFTAMREDVFVPIRERLDAILFSEKYDDPLDAVAASIEEFFQVLDERPALRQMFEIMTVRCEHADVQAEAARPAMEFLEKVEQVYLKAAAKGTLRPGLDPVATARDTWAFANGLLHVLLGQHCETELPVPVSTMISAHMALRRKS